MTNVTHLGSFFFLFLGSILPRKVSFDILNNYHIPFESLVILVEFMLCSAGANRAVFQLVKIFVKINLEITIEC